MRDQNNIMLGMTFLATLIFTPYAWLGIIAGLGLYLYVWGISGQISGTLSDKASSKLSILLGVLFFLDIIYLVSVNFIEYRY